MGSSLPNWYDFFMSPLEKGKFRRIRKALLNEATGQVLELGSGTGINFPLYETATSVLAIEPNQDMIDRSRLKLNKAVVPIELVKASAENLPFEDDTFDSVVATLVFCTIPNVEIAMNEIKRVCKPQGKILIFEHVRLENRFLSKMQDSLTPAWKKICDGCCLNRDTIGLVKDENLTIIKTEKYFNGLFVKIEIRNDVK